MPRNGCTASEYLYAMRWKQIARRAQNDDLRQARKRYGRTQKLDYLMLAIDRDRKDYLTLGNAGAALDLTAGKYNLLKLLRPKDVPDPDV